MSLEQPQTAPEQRPNDSGDPGGPGGADVARERAAREPAGLLGGDQGAEPDGENGGKTPEPGRWRPDWRDAMVASVPEKEREATAKRLGRFASPETLFKSYREMERRQASGQLRPALADDASPEEVAAYRKNAGIPEKAEGYGLEWSTDALKGDEGAKATLGGFQSLAHEMNLSPDAAKKLVAWYEAEQDKTLQKAHEASQTALVETQASLRSEWGRDYGRNLKVANEFVAQHGGEEAKGLMGLRLADGTALGAHLGFVKLIANAALASADDATLVTSEPDRGGKSIDAEIDEIYALQRTDRRKYESQATQDRLNTLVAARDRKRSAA